MLNMAIVQELAGLATYHNKTWAYPSQQTILERLRKFHGQTISLRTLNRHMAALVACGWLRRVVRHHEDKKVGWVFRSTLYVLLGPCWRMVKRMAKTVAFAARWTRVPYMANDVTPTVLKSSPGPLSGASGNSKKDNAANFASLARKLLAG